MNFLHRGAAQPLPELAVQGCIELLRKHINVESNDDFLLIVSAMVNAMMARNNSYIITIIIGEQGSAKSTVSKFISQLIDPMSGATLSPPKSIDDLMVTALHRHFLSYDNLSSVSTNLADALCRLSTGGGSSSRKLFTNNEEVVFEVKRPFALNGINLISARPDLLDRAIVIELPKMQSQTRRSEEQVLEEFESDKPAIFRGFLDLVSDCLRLFPQISASELPRMADFAKCGLAVETSLGLKKGTFLSAYEKNRKNALRSIAEVDQLCLAIDALLQIKNGKWEGSPTELFEHLWAMDEQIFPHKRISSPIALSRSLRRIPPLLEALDVQIDFKKGKKRKISLRQVSNPSTSPEIDALNTPKF